jgi:RNA 2',3'-cyclic 3'-phosphodiesterase
MRLFIGIPLSDEVVRELSALTAKLKSPSDGLRWSSSEGWHITLQFLGNTGAAPYACVARALQQIRHASFEVQLEPPGFFDNAGVFFAGVKLSVALTRLQQLVTVATKPCGFAPEDRPYHPHITLARAKGGRGPLKALKSRIVTTKEFSSFTASEFLLYESYPGPGGSRYEVRERFALSRAC